MSLDIYELKSGAKVRIIRQTAKDSKDKLSALTYLNRKNVKKRQTRFLHNRQVALAGIGEQDHNELSLILRKTCHASSNGERST